MIRPARDDDYAAFAALFAELGVDDPVPPFARWCADLMPSTLVAEDAGRVIGYIDCYVLDTIGYVRNLVVAAAARNTGTGAALMHAAAALLRARGIAVWELNVKQSNAPAVHLYEKLGLRSIYTSAALHMPWEVAARLPAEPAVVEPVTDAAAVEARFGILRGRLAQLAKRPTRVIVQLRDGGDIVGVAAFDPDFPGANLFHVARPALAGTLLAALRLHARHDYTLILVEADAVLAEHLANAGAEVRYRLFHMRGNVASSSSNSAV